jgi:hypothetical protein
MAIEQFKKITKDDESEGGYIVDFFEEILEEKSLATDIKFEYQINEKQKNLVKLTKIPDQYSAIIGKDILVQFNADYFDLIDDDELRKILIEQEIDKIQVNMKTGAIKITKHLVSTSKGMVDKWTFDKVQKAIEVEDSIDEQIKETNK